MVYVDTSVLVALIVNEPASAAVARWYASTRADLATAAWCVAEFASALGIKQRTGQIDARQAAEAWDRFQRLVTHDVRLLPVDLAAFERAAALTLDASSALRAGDALHLACAERAGAKGLATLDAVMQRNAKPCGMKPVVFKR
jgi:uncharacterized protein